MKKITLVLITCFLISTAVSGQGFYFRGGLGYAVPQAGQTSYASSGLFAAGSLYNGTTTTVDTNVSYNIKKASFSSGLHGAFGFGYMFNNHVGIDLTMDFGLATTKYTYKNNNVSLDTTGTLYDLQTIEHAKTPVMLIPALVVQTGGDVVNLYTRLGIVLPISTKIMQDQIVTNHAGAGAVETDDYSFQIQNSFSIGFSATAGVSYKLSDRFSIWGEAGFLSVAAYAKQATLLTITATSLGQTQNIPLSYYSGPTTINYSSNFTTNPNNGNLQPTYSQPFSNFGVNVGFTIALGGHHRSNGGTGTRDSGGFKRKGRGNF